MKLHLPLLLLGALLASFSQVQADNTSVSGSSNSVFSDNAISPLADDTVVYNPIRGEVKVVAQAFEGAGEIQQTGLGTVSLTGAVTDFTGSYLINGGGTLQFNFGVGTVNGKTVLSNNSTVSFNIASDNVDWAGSFEGNGNILKAGGGTLTIKNLTGAYGSGNVMIQSGTVFINAGGNAAVFGAEGSTGSITVDGATLKLAGDNYVFNKTINLQKGGKLLNDDARNLVLNGALNVTGEAQIEFNHDKAITLNGDLAGDSNAVLNLVVNSSSLYGGVRSLTLTGSGENFKGTINLSSLNTRDGDFSMILILGNENAAANALVNLSGIARSPSKLLLAVESATIRKISGTQYGQVNLADGTTSATLTIKEGGVYGGSFGDGVNLITNGELVLGNTAGVTMKGAIGGTGALKVANGAQLTLSGANTYTGSTTLGLSSSLTLTAGASINAQSSLIMSDSALTVSTGSKQVFNGVQLLDNVSSTISLSGEGSALGLGSISGAGTLIISGATTIDGTLADANCRVFFISGTNLYYANASGNTLSQGTAIGALLATGNLAAQSYTLSTSLTMTNAGKETIADLFIQGLTADGTKLTLAGQGLDITGGLSFNGNGKSMAISGATLSAGSISASGGGTLNIESELLVDNKRKTSLNVATGTTMALTLITVNDGTLVFGGTSNVTALKIGALGGTLTFKDGSNSNALGAISFVDPAIVLNLNGGNEGAVTTGIIPGSGSTLNVSSGKLGVAQGQTQNFNVNEGATLTFQVNGNVDTALGIISGTGIVAAKNVSGGNQDLQGKKFGGDWSLFGGRVVLDGGGQQMRQTFSSVIGSSLTVGGKATVEVINGSQYWDQAEASLTRKNDWVLGASNWNSEGLGTIRLSGVGINYSGNITVLSGGASMGSSESATITLAGDISGDTLTLGSYGSTAGWKMDATLTGNNSGLKGIDVQRGTMTAKSATALGKNLNLLKGDDVASRVNIEAAVTLETVNGVAGSLLNIATGSSLTVTGAGDSTFNGTLSGGGALNLNGSGKIGLTADNSGYTGNIVVGGSNQLTVDKMNSLGTDNKISIEGGTLRYTGTGFKLNAPLAFTNGGVLSFSQSQTLDRAISGYGSINMDAGAALNIQGQLFTGTVGLTLNGNNVVTFTGTSPIVQNMGNLTVNNAGNVLNFIAGGQLVLNMSNSLFGEGALLTLSGYDYSNSNYLRLDGLTAWQKLDGIKIINGKGEEVDAMVDTRGRVQAYQKEVMYGGLVSSGVTSTGTGYNYTSNTQYYGALDGKDVDFSQPFTFSPGAVTYGFTTRDDIDTGMKAGSFIVSSKMSDDGSASRVVSIIGQADATGRTVTLTNTTNSFTGDVTVTNAILKADAADPGSLGHGAVSILGVNNTVFIQENATVDLATGNGVYTYSNNFTLNGSNTTLKQTDGQHTLTGTVSIQGGDRSSRLIENALDEGSLTLSGALNVRGENTLTLKTKAGADSLIVLALNGNATLSALNVEGHVRQTKSTVMVSGGMTLGANASYDLAGGALVVAGSLTSSGGAERVVTMGNGTTLSAVGDRMEVGQGVTLAFAQEQTSFALDTGAGMLSFLGNLGTATANNTLVKRGSGSLELVNSITTKATIKVEQGTLTVKEGTNLVAEGDFAIQNGSVLNLEKGSSLSLSFARTLTFNGSLTGQGSISGAGKLTFENGTRYAANMSGQSWNATFKMGSSFSGTLLKHTGNIVFENGSHILFDTTLPVSEGSIGISTSGNATVRFNGAIVEGTSSSPEVDWDTTQSYVFTLVRSQKDLLGFDGQVLTQDSLGQSVRVGGNGWGVFLQGDLSLSEDGKELLATVTRNGNVISSYAQTGNQAVVGRALDYVMDNYSSLGLRGTELGDIIQYFNKMGQNIAAEAPEALGMVGGLSNYQALAGQRTDMMRHVEAVRQRAHAGKGLVGISNIPDNSFWAEGTQSYSRVDGVDNSAPGYTAQTWGGAIGVDYLSGPNYSLGVAFAYSNMKVDSDQYAGQTKSDNYYIDLYGRWESGNWNGVVVLSGGTASVDVKRTLHTGPDTYQGKGSADGTQIIGMAEVAYDWQWEEEGPVLQPYLGMAVGGTQLDGYTESGLGNAGLVLDEQKQTVAQASLGVRLYKQNIDKEMQYETSRWELRCGLVEEFGDTDFVTRSSFLGLPGYTMSTTSDDIGRTGLQIGGGFSYAFDQAWSVFGDVNGEFRNGQTNMNSTLGLRCTF